MQPAVEKEGQDLKKELDPPLSASVNSTCLEESYPDILFKRSDFGFLDLLPVSKIKELPCQFMWFFAVLYVRAVRLLYFKKKTKL